MSTKTTLLAIIGVIVIGGALYFSAPKEISKESDLSSLRETKGSLEKPFSQLDSEGPKNNASSDEIIDYIVDNLTENETKSIEKAFEANISSQDNVVISTNF